MNIPILASEIVRRVYRSPDSATNLEQVVSQLIREEQERDRIAMESGMIEMGFKECVEGDPIKSHRTED